MEQRSNPPRQSMLRRTILPGVVALALVSHSWTRPPVRVSLPQREQQMRVEQLKASLARNPYFNKLATSRSGLSLGPRQAALRASVASKPPAGNSLEGEIKETLSEQWYQLRRNPANHIVHLGVNGALSLVPSPIMPNSLSTWIKRKIYPNYVPPVPRAERELKIENALLKMQVNNPASAPGVWRQGYSPGVVPSRTYPQPLPVAPPRPTNPTYFPNRDQSHLLAGLRMRLPARAGA